MAVAQSLPPPGGNWTITNTATFNVTGDGVYMEYPPPQTTSFSDNDAYVQATAYPNWDGSASECRATVPVTFTITWTGSGAAPDHVDIKTAKSVQVGRYLVYGSGGSGYGDSLGDPGGNDQNVENGVFNTTQSHARVIRLPVSNGQATFNALLDITIFSPTTTHLPDYSDSVSVVCHDKVTIDNREVNISSSLDPTYYRGTDSNGNPVPVQNIRQPDGTMYGDTVEPPAGGIIQQGFSVDYQATPGGSWSQNSQYGWTSSLTGAADSGTFNPDSINDLVPIYFNPPAADGTSDHIYIHLFDAADGTDATNNYYMRFHAPVPQNEWVQTNHLIHPLPTGGVPYPITNPGEWHIVGPYNNRTSVTDSVTYTESTNVSASITGSIAAVLPAGEEADAFLANMGITLGLTSSSGSSQSYTAQIPPYSAVDIEWGPGIDEYDGNCGVYGDHGFMGVYDWTAHVPQGSPGGQLAIRFTSTPVPLQN